MRTKKHIIEAALEGDLQEWSSEQLVIELQRRLHGGEPIARISVGSVMRQRVEAKRGKLRPRSLAELRSIDARLLRCWPELEQRSLMGLDADDCERLLEECFSSPRQRQKGRVVLHGLFAFGMKREYCLNNPVARLEAERLEEQEIVPLNWQELKRLCRAMRRQEHRSCMAAMGLMLWAGVRPAEVERLEWGQIDWEERVVVIRPRHSKTGGSRHVSLYPALAAWLREAGVKREGLICPRNWGRRWKEARVAARVTPWRQDVLRHSFASYHLKRWHDLARLQSEMGHRSADLLRSRYLSMRGIGREEARRFWTPGAL